MRCWRCWCVTPRRRNSSAVSAGPPTPSPSGTIVAPCTGRPSTITQSPARASGDDQGRQTLLPGMKRGPKGPLLFGVVCGLLGRDRLVHELLGVEVLADLEVVAQELLDVDLGVFHHAHVAQRLLHLGSEQADLLDDRHYAGEQARP